MFGDDAPIPSRDFEKRVEVRLAKYDQDEAVVNLTNCRIDDSTIAWVADRLMSVDGLKTLNIGSNSIGDAGAEQIARLQGLTTLDIRDNSIGEAGAEQIARLQGLTTLDIWGNSIGGAGAEQIARLQGLTTLNIRSNSIGEAGAEQIARLQGLTTLDITNNSIGEAGAEQIARLQGLTTLDISHNSIGEAGAEQIARLQGLTTLNIRSNSIGEAGAEQIARLQGLTTLDISHNSIGEAGAEQIARLQGLTTLNISHNSIGEAGAEQIARLQGLTTLHVWSNSIGDAGAEQIARLQGLTTLDISLNSIGEAGAEQIARLQGLKTLDISNNSIGEAGAEQIARLQGLTTLKIGNNSIGEGGSIVALLERLTHLEKIDISGNPLKTPRGNEIDLSGFIGDSPPGLLLRYLRSVIEDEQRGTTLCVPEARLVLLGSGTNGKSQLAGALGGKLKKGEMVREEDRTLGVEIERLTVQTKSHGEVRVRIFDGGGQPEQFQMHLLWWESLRNAMLLVIDSTKLWGWTGNRGDYFLRMIESHFRRRRDRGAEDQTTPPVLAVVTKADVKVATIEGDQRPTPEKIRAVAGMYHVDLSVVDRAINSVMHDGLAEVKSAIANVLEKTTGISAVLPASFGKVRSAVQEQFGSFEKTNPPKTDVRMMALSSFRQICAEEEQDDLGQQDVYLRILHALGDVLHAPDDPELADKVINTHWAA